MTGKNSVLFTATQIAHLKLSNKLAVAPMTRVSAQLDGTVGPLMKEYYEDFAKGGFGLVITEGLYTDELYSQAYYMQPGIVSKEQSESWKPVINSVHASGGKIIAQLMHAGALSQFNAYKEQSAAPSSVQPKGEQMPFYYGEGLYNEPLQMTQQDIKDAIMGFANSAVQAKSAGFDGVEIHGANGYLLDQFLTDYTNKRNDEYGGVIANRLRIYREIVEAVRAAVGTDFIIGVRFSQKKVNDSQHVWSEGEAGAEYIFGLMGECQVDYIHTTEPDLDKAAFNNGDSLSFLAKKYSGLPVISNGGVNEPDRATSMLDSEQADLISLGRVALANPDWPVVVKNSGTIKLLDFDMLAPIANLENATKFLTNQTVDI
jgi:2,4-dienoyl-CoA reductase-like NADH-dependent reductase (Old Yellow Enzyme family)